MLNILFFIYLGFTCTASLYILIVSIVNLIFFRRNSRLSEPESCPMVSILVPARNEAEGIADCLRPLLNQNYPNYEVLVLDDLSTDNTWKILQSLKQESDLLQVFRSGGLPEGWRGKNHALHQLSKKAKGDILICIDADMEAQPALVTWTVGNLQKQKVDSLSAWPRHTLPSFLENFIVPVIYISTGFLVPLQFIRNTATPLFSHAIGQFIAFKKDSFWKINGYESVKNKINEDVNIAREIKKAGMKHIFLDGKRHLQGEMYDGSRAAFTGIKRTIYEFFDKKIYPILIFSAFILFCLVLPPFLTFLPLIGGSLWNLLFGLCSLMFLASWGITLYQRRLKWFSPFFYPVQMLMIIIIAWKSMIDMRSGKGYLWKGRKVL